MTSYQSKLFESKSYTLVEWRKNVFYQKTWNYPTDIKHKIFFSKKSQQ